MKKIEHRVKAKLWLYPGKGGWYFCTISEEVGAELRREFTWKRGFGSIPVRVTVGQTSWETSVFPEKSGTYLLPIKKSVRVVENLESGDAVEIKLVVRK